MRQRTFQISMFIMLMFGALDMLRSVAAPLMQRDWQLSYLQLGVAFGAYSLAYLVGSLAGGFAVDRAGLKATIVGGGVGIVIGIWCIVWIPSYAGLVVGFALMGFASGFVEIGTNAVIPAIVERDQNQAKYFNWLHGAYGAGGFIFPIVAGSLIRITHSWRNVYVDLSIMLLAGLAIALFTRYRRQPKQVTDVSYETVDGVGARTDATCETLESMGARTDASETPTELGAPRERPGTLGAVLREPVFYGLIAAISTYVMAEIGVANWLPLYLVQQRHVSVFASAVYLSGFYFTYTVGRMTAHLWVERIGNHWAIVASAVFSMAMLAIAMVGNSLAMCAFVAAGLGFAVIFPTIAAIATQTFSDHSGKVLGFLYAASGTGALVVNTVIGFVSTRFGLTAGFATIFPFMFAAILSILFVAVASNRKLRATQIVTTLV